MLIESPVFYGALQTIERLRLTAIELPTDPYSGVSIKELEAALSDKSVKACWLMSKFQNPLGASLSLTKKKAVYELLAKNDVPLIEDD
ncbi:PLP-dependent aminotransferase family protein, partial [Vibrio natriegens]